MSQHHHIDAGPDTVHWGYFDAALEPVLTIESGDKVTISTVSGAREVMPLPFFRIPEALTAVPIAINGAKTGEVLQVHIKEIVTAVQSGQSCRAVPTRLA